ncbi:MAG: Grx4 family monothiol glutaredoxin [Candidatus Pacebacteria bacterium]|nr:Grx4 family monothiol glutaredoxin [Candidatus Paceibacterota bacterium]
MSSSIHDKIAAEIASEPVVLFMKGTPVAPQCGFSATVVQILTQLGVPFKGINVLADAELRQGIKEFNNWPTIPQLFIKGEFIGGCDIVKASYQSGELAQQLTDAGINLGQNA